MSQSASGTRPKVDSRPRILILGGGYVGLYTTMRLLRKLRRREADITVIDPRSYMTYQPFLPEASAGSLDARHVVVPLRKVLKGAEILNARVLSVDHTRKVVRVAPLEGPDYDVPYDIVVVALGLDRPHAAHPRPGRRGRRLQDGRGGDLPAQPGVGEPRRRRVDGGRGATQPRADLRLHRWWLRRGRGDGRARGHGALRNPLLHKGFAVKDLRFVMVEATDRILPEVGEDMGRWTVEQLRKRGIEMALSTRLESCRRRRRHAVQR